MTPSEHLQQDARSATELLARRAQLQEWLSRLDGVDDIPAQVARRVRADYEQRLSNVVAELSAHSEALAADRERLDETLLAAAERHDAAADALEEARLRHRIGELSPEEWESRRPGLESELEAAAAERAETEREIAALEELFAQISDTTPADEVTVEAAPAAGQGDEWRGESQGSGFAEEADEWDPELPMLEETADQAEADAPADEVVVTPGPEPEPMEAVNEPLDVGAYTPEPAAGEPEQGPVDDDLVEITNFAAAAEALADEVDPAPADDDYAFLEELDRAIAATAPNLPVEEEEPSEETRPQPGLKCPDCGYSNDPAAWYCGVCGVDLG